MRAVNKILFITLTNIGDVILTLPALDLVRQRYPCAQITVVAGARVAGLFTHNPAVARFLAFDKHAPLSGKVRFFRQLQAEKFDLVIDLRNSLLGFLLGDGAPKLLRQPCRFTHASREHCAKVSAILKNGNCLSAKGGSLHISADDKEYIAGLLNRGGRKDDEKVIVISPGARSHTKRWSQKNYCALAESLTQETGYQVVLVGDADDQQITGVIARNVKGVRDLAGRTTLTQLAALFLRAAIVITNDSANLHLAGYLDIPTVGIFGPTNERRYGPWSRNSRVVSAACSCRPCMKAQCEDSSLRCLTSIAVAEVKDAVLQVLAKGGHK